MVQSALWGSWMSRSVPPTGRALEAEGVRPEAEQKEAVKGAGVTID